jgi:DNA-binding NtrC family response regulator
MRSVILVVDDEAAICRTMGRILGRAGFDVVTAQSSKEAFNILQSTPVAVVLSDHLMPDCTGIEFLERCAREFPMTSQILVTGHADAQMAASAIHRTEVMRLILKPWNQHDLLTAIRDGVWKYELLLSEMGVDGEEESAS